MRFYEVNAGRLYALWEKIYWRKHHNPVHSAFVPDGCGQLKPYISELIFETLSLK
jgi:hypothetical protein